MHKSKIKIESQKEISLEALVSIGEKIRGRK